MPTNKNSLYFSKKAILCCEVFFVLGFHEILFFHLYLKHILFILTVFDKREFLSNSVRCVNITQWQETNIKKDELSLPLLLAPINNIIIII